MKTSGQKKIITVVGARPQFVKCAVLRRLLDESSDIAEVLVHTGQHYDVQMSDVFFEELRIRKPEYSLGISSRTHGAMTGAMLERIEAILLLEKPDACVVYGDTNSTLAGALSAAKLHIPVYHVEAGLRSFNKKMPEEVNRILTDHVSRLLFCSTEEGVKNLQNENITDNVFHVGDIMYDAVQIFSRHVDVETIKRMYGAFDCEIAICTIHRAENTNSPERLRRVFDFVERYNNQYKIIFPVHPGTRAKAEQMGVALPAVHIVEPLPYIELQSLLSVSSLVLTDSGGLQKESYFHGVPCITLRDETEWTETIECGWNALWTDPVHRPRRKISSYGDGKSGQKILELIRGDLFGDPVLSI